MTPAKIDKPTTLHVTRTIKGNSLQEPLADMEVIAVHQFQTEPAKVKVGMGMTVNLGNYEAARLDLAIEVPCYREEVNEAFTSAHNYLEIRFNKELKELRDLVAGKPQKMDTF